ARGDSTIRLPWRTSRGSQNPTLRRASAALVAGWLSPTNLEAAHTLQVASTRMAKKFALQVKLGSYATQRGLAARFPVRFLGRSMVPIANRRANGGAHGVGTHPGLHQRDGGPGAAAAE